MVSFSSVANSLRRSQPMRLSSGALGIFLVASLDYLTGVEIRFGLFYLAPILLVTWLGSRRSGLLMALLATVVSRAVNTLAGESHSHPLIPFWNALVNGGFFASNVLLLGKLKETLEREAQSSRTDYLTGVANTRCFYEQVERDMNWCRRKGRPLTIAYIDCDNFKTVNDTQGHPAGDALLVQVATTIKSNLRPQDTVGRLGGDEFAVLFFDTDEEESRNVLVRLHAALCTAMQGREVGVTFSVGAITFANLPASVDAMVKAADDIMYGVKKGTKNRLHHVRI